MTDSFKYFSVYSHFMNEPSSQQLIPIVGAGYSILPEVALRGEDVFQSNRYAQLHSLEVLPLRAVSRTARAVKAESPTDAFRKYARRVDSNLRQDLIDESYIKLHDQIWNRYLVRAKEVLIWSNVSMRPRVVGEEETAKLKSALLMDYKVPANEDVFNISGIESPTMQVKWPAKDGTTTKALAKLFELDPKTYVYTNTDTNFKEGIRALVAYFRDRERPNLNSDWDPWNRYSDMGSLLGRKIQDK